MSSVKSDLLKNGFAILKNVYELALINDLAQFVDSVANEELDHVIGPCGNDAERVSKLNQLYDQTGAEINDTRIRDCLVGNMPLEMRLDERLRPLFNAPKLLHLLTEIFDSENIYFHMAPAVRCVLPKSVHCKVPPHQDASYNSHLVAQKQGIVDFVTVWVPFCSIDDECGGVEFFRESLKDSFCTPEYEGLWLKALNTVKYESFHCKVNAGDVVLFTKDIVHGSRPNNSNRRRYSLDCRAFGEYTTTSKHYLDIKRNVIVPPKADTY